MIQISHRGNINGAIPELENSPDYIIKAIDKGFDVEIDVWIKNNIIYFGHAEPQYLISPELFYKVRDHAWFHCKNLDALNHFIKFYPTARFFWHQEDMFTLTSNNYIWTYPGNAVSENSIIVYLGQHKEVRFSPEPFAICSDYCYTSIEEK
jgi:hypothetical protein